MAEAKPAAGADVRALRERLLGPTYTLFYDEPLHIVRAEGVWMYDADGRAYLDAYNNVPVVGHCHPYVVEQLARQARTLNIHTRYVTKEPLELAQRLLATLPSEIGQVVFTCTGSEANDLAVRVSKAATGGTGFIVTEHAYHGTTETIAGMSPSASARLGSGVFTIRAPFGPGGAAEFGARVQDCIERMQAERIRPAALLVDTIFSSDGIASDPPGFLADAVHRIRAAGGLFITDEVQPGFGRTGSMWGFERHGVVPDIVTMGKPMGNGHPMAAMASRPELLAEFAKTTRYFNTFGGNSVSGAVGLAVLDVIEREKLMNNALTIGEYLKQGLGRLAARYDSVREIRGTGLFLGVSISTGREAARIVNDLVRRGVLIGSTGSRGDVLKIRPPLCLARAGADLLLDTLDQSLGSQD